MRQLTCILIATFSAILINASAKPELANSSNEQNQKLAAHQQKGNTTVYFFGLQYCRIASELPNHVTKCSIFKEDGSDLRFPCYVTSYLQCFTEVHEHNGSIKGGINLSVKDLKASPRAASIKIASDPELLKALAPMLPEDYVPNKVDKVFYHIVQVDPSAESEELSVSIQGGFEDQVHEFKFMP